MRLRSRGRRVMVLLICVSIAPAVIAQRSANPGNSGNARETTLQVVDKTRPMLEMVELLQRRTGRPISYEDPVWGSEAFKERQPAVARGAKTLDLPSLVRASFETKIFVDARTHLLPEPVDGALRSAFDRIMADYARQQLPGSFLAGQLGDFGWLVVPQAQPRILDTPISFPAATRSTEATFELIVQAVQQSTRQRVVLKHVVSDGTAGTRTTLEPLKLPRGQTVTLGANNEPARWVIANALRAIDRGDPRLQGPVPQRAWRLLYLHERQEYALDFVEVRQETYSASGRVTGSMPVTWQVVTPLARNDAESTLQPLSVSPITPAGPLLPPGGPPVSAFGTVSPLAATPAAPVVGAISTPLVPDGVLLSNGAIVPRSSVAATTPSGNSKRLVENVCTGCHDFSLVSQKRLSRADWDLLVRSMVDRGAPLQGADIGAAVDYLATTYR